MNKNLSEELKKQLEKEKKEIEGALGEFAKKDESLKDDWDTKFPRMREGGKEDLEAAAGEVEQYSTLLPIEHSLELKLKNINSALEKIKKGKFGNCEACGKNINEERLKIHPAARHCMDCKNKGL